MSSLWFCERSVVEPDPGCRRALWDMESYVALGLGSCCRASGVLALRQKGVIVPIPGATRGCNLHLTVQEVRSNDFVLLDSCKTYEESESFLCWAIGRSVVQCDDVEGGREPKEYVRTGNHEATQLLGSDALPPPLKVA